MGAESSRDTDSAEAAADFITGGSAREDSDTDVRRARAAARSASGGSRSAGVGNTIQKYEDVRVPLFKNVDRQVYDVAERAANKVYSVAHEAAAAVHALIQDNLETHQETHQKRDNPPHVTTQPTSAAGALVNPKLAVLLQKYLLY